MIYFTFLQIFKINEWTINNFQQKFQQADEVYSKFVVFL